MPSIFIPLSSGVKFTLKPNANQINHARAISHNTFPHKKKTCYAIVMAVDETELTVDEYESDNGKALIKCHDDSNETGDYLYVYRKNTIEIKCNIISLIVDNEEQEPIQTNMFTSRIKT